MALPTVTDFIYTFGQFERYVSTFANSQLGNYRVVLVPDGLELRYNLVFQCESGPKFRIRVRHSDSPSQISSIWDVWLILRKLLLSGCEASDDISNVVEPALRSSNGTVMVVVEDHKAAAAYFHEGELRP